VGIGVVRMKGLGKYKIGKEVEYAGISEREFLDFSFQFSDKDSGQQRIRMLLIPLNINKSKLAIIY
jgi:hypothetical protein